MISPVAASGLVKAYERTPALDGLDLDAARARFTDSWGPTAQARRPRSAY
jgi:hypothetical protein